MLIRAKLKPHETTFHIENMPSPEEATLPFCISSFGLVEKEIFVNWAKSERCFIIYSYKGKGEAFFDKEWHPLPEGSLLYVPNTCRPKYRPIDEKPWNTIYFTYTSKNNSALLGDRHFILNDSRLAGIPDILNRMFSPDGTIAPIDELYSKYFYLIVKIRNVAHNFSLYTSLEPIEYRLKKSIVYVAEHFSEELSLSKLSAMCSVSKEYYCKMFKKLQGVSFGNFIKALRISRACEKLIIHPDMKMSTIAVECGFKTDAYFTRVFKKEMGCTPSEFRNSNR